MYVYMYVCVSLDLMASFSPSGLVQGRDGGRGGAGYMNLPSPNVAAEVGEGGRVRGEGSGGGSG